MKNRNIKDNKDLEKKLIEALVLKVVATPNGYLNIKNIMEEFKTTLSLSSVSSFSDVYNSLAGKTYKDISGLLSAYNDLVAKSSGNSAGGGGGTNIKSDNGSYTGMTIDMEKFDNTITQPLTNPIDMDIFSDIANVQWAKEAIVNLKIKGVISGKTDTIFAPNDNVTREEFTKMIISAVALDADKSEIGFADAKPGMWYYPYLQQAKGVGIINGISDTYFGVGNPITRQDMAVIIYNAARYKDVIGNSAPDDFPFGDDNDISSYAKNAVYTLKTMEIITGVDSVNFAPKAFATRAQAAVMIYRLLLK